MILLSLRREEAEEASSGRLRFDIGLLARRGRGLRPRPRRGLGGSAERRRQQLVTFGVQALPLFASLTDEQAARVLTAWYPHVAVKLGAEGALFYANGRPPVRVPAPPVDRVVDGTGAGDAFIAGFLPAWLDKKPPGEALAGGCRLAAHALGLIGARPVL